MNVLRRFWDEHPRLSMWIVLAIGMVVIMVFAARNVGFTAWQWVWLVLITIGLAGLCTWIISWGDDDEEEEDLELPAAQETTQEPADEPGDDEHADQ